MPSASSRARPSTSSARCTCARSAKKVTTCSCDTGRSLTMASSLLLCAAHGTCRLLRGRGAPAARLRTDEEVEDLTDRTLPDRRLRERKVVLHDVAVAS